MARPRTVAGSEPSVLVVACCGNRERAVVASQPALAYLHLCWFCDRIRRSRIWEEYLQLYRVRRFDRFIRVHGRVTGERYSPSQETTIAELDFVKAPPSVQRTRASRWDHYGFVSQWRLALAADAER